MKRKLVVFVTVLCMLAFAACSKSGSGDTNGTTPTEAPTQEPAATPTEAPTPTVDNEADRDNASTAEIATWQIENGAVENGIEGAHGTDSSSYINPDDVEPKTGDDDTDVYTIVPPDLPDDDGYEIKEADRLMAAYNGYILQYCAKNPDAAEKLCILTIDMEKDGYPEIVMGPDYDRYEFIILKYNTENDTVMSFGPYASNEGLAFFIGSTVFLTADEDENRNETGRVYTITDNEAVLNTDIYINYEDEVITVNGENISEEEALNMIYASVTGQTGITDQNEIEMMMEYVDIYDLWELDYYDGDLMELLGHLFRQPDDYDAYTVDDDYGYEQLQEFDGSWILTGGSYLSSETGAEVSFDGTETMAVFDCQAALEAMSFSLSSPVVPYEIEDIYMLMSSVSDEGGKTYATAVSDDEERSYTVYKTEDGLPAVEIRVANNLGEDVISLIFEALVIE